MRQPVSYSMWPVPLTISEPLESGAAEPQRMSGWQIRSRKFILKAQTRDIVGSMMICAMTTVSMSMTRECFVSAGPEIFGLP